MDRVDVINFLIKKNDYKSYLEIGLDNPALCYLYIECEHKESIDPYSGGNFYDANNLPQIILDNLTYRATSDEAFASMPSDKKYDIIFVDGLHEYRQVVRDIVNSLHHLNKGGKIVIHDCLPETEKAAFPIVPNEPIAWNGDVYKAIMQLEWRIPVYYTLNEDYGICIIDYFDGCEKLQESDFPNENLTFDYYIVNRQNKMRIITQEQFNQIYGAKKEKSDICLFEMGHKPWEQKINSRFIIPLQVSSVNSKYNLAELKDNMGDNIAELNPIYGEVTGIYWIWKNYLDKGYKYIGQTTYRRPFMVDEDFNFDEMFNNYDIVLPQKMYFGTDVYSQYAVMHNIKDLEIVIGIIRDKYPEYIPDIVGMLLQDYLYNSNGFIMKAEDYDKYCKFLFDVLFEWQNITGIHTPDEMRKYLSDEFDKGNYTMFGRNEKEAAIKYQMRTLGFLSERIFNIYVNHNFKKPFIIPYKVFVK